MPLAPATSATPKARLERREPLLGLDRASLGERIGRLGVPERQSRMRVGQLWNWLYVRGATDFAAMTNIAKEFRGELGQRFTLGRPEIVTEQVSVDGTRKWLLRLDDGREVETVYIPEEDRGTLCISSQVGCTLTCSFCHTGTQRLVRNLTPGEIVGQIMIARDRLGDWPGTVANDPRGIPETMRKITNVVLMGMGEPLLNYENTLAAVRRLIDQRAVGIAPGRVTLSTAGIAPGIERLAHEDLPIKLAISLHAATDDLRDRLVPINRRYPLDDLFAATRRYASTTQRRVMFEWALIGGVNDTPEQAQALVERLDGLPTHVNLIRLNPTPSYDGRPSKSNAIDAFAAVLDRAGMPHTMRQRRGAAIEAGCGQLRSRAKEG